MHVHPNTFGTAGTKSLAPCPGTLFLASLLHMFCNTALEIFSILIRVEKNISDSQIKTVPNFRKTSIYSVENLSLGCLDVLARTLL